MAKETQKKQAKKVPASGTVRPNFYINNKEFTAEIMRCKAAGKLSNKAVDYFILLANRTILKMKYSNPLDREDCIQSALMDMCKYWQNFDIAKSNNAFSFFTQFVKNGVAKEYKRIHRQPGIDEKEPKVKVISLSSHGDSEVFSL